LKNGMGSSSCQEWVQKRVTTREIWEFKRRNLPRPKKGNSKKRLNHYGNLNLRIIGSNPKPEVTRTKNTQRGQLRSPPKR